MPILDWLLSQHCPEYAIESDWADLARVPNPPKTLQDKIRIALDLYPCDLLFIHRDAEKVPFEVRHIEITRAVDGLETPSTICVIPVRMQEAWLLFNEPAIRKAAGNPNGRNTLNLPNIRLVENIPDPKEVLFSIIRESSGLHGTRLKKLKLHKCAFLVSQFIDDFSPLRLVDAFQKLEQKLEAVIVANSWETVNQ